MVVALAVFRRSFVRELVQTVVGSLDWVTSWAVVESSSEAVAYLSSHNLDVVVFDPTFVDDVNHIMAVAGDARRPSVIVLCHGGIRRAYARAVKNGADFVASVAGEFAEREHQICDPPSAEVTFMDYGKVSRHEEPIVIHVLDNTDREIVRLIATGATDREISASVFLSNQTVRNRISGILRRTGARNRTHLACVYLGLVGSGLSPFSVVLDSFELL